MPRVKAFDTQETLEKALELFWEKGYEATSIQDLVDFLGVNRASLYATYGDKRTLFIQAFLHYQDQNQKFLISFFEDHDDVRRGLRSLFEQSMKTVPEKCGKGCFTVNSTVALRAEHVEMTQILKKNREVFESIFRDFLQKGVLSKQISAEKDLSALAGLLFTYYYGLRAVAKIQRGVKDEMKAVDALLKLL